MIDYTYVGRRITWHNYRKIHTKYDFETKHSASVWKFYHRWRISGNHPWEMRRR